MTLYECLGVPPDATDEQITAAYRVQAKNFHPDRNPGDDFAAARYAAVDEAYTVLSDPDRRREYDHNGTTKAPRDPRQELAATVMPYFMQALHDARAGGRNIRNADLLHMLKQKMEIRQAMLEESKADYGRAKADLEHVVGRFKVPADEENLFDSALRQQLTAIDADLATINAELDRLQRALNWLKKVTYIRDTTGVTPSFTDLFASGRSYSWNDTYRDTAQSRKPNKTLPAKDDDEPADAGD